MIIMDDLIFVENPKTASKSISVMLEKHGGNRSLVKRNHTALVEFNEMLPKKKFRVVVVRNPFDRMVSGWLYTVGEKRGGGKEEFKSWIKGWDWTVAPGIDFKRTSQLYWMSHCNIVIRFEKVEEGLRRVLEKVGIVDYELPHMHKSVNRQPYQEYYDEEAKAIISDRFAMDLEKLEYSF
jgi:hypothetical protein